MKILGASPLGFLAWQVPAWALLVAIAAIALPAAGFIAYQTGKTSGLERQLKSEKDSHAKTQSSLTACAEAKGGLTGANVAWAATTARQSEAIEALAVDTAAARAAAEKAAAASTQAATTAKTSADRILSAKPQSADLCREASALFDQVLAEQRR